MPEVTGQALDVALSDIESAGFSDNVEVVGGGLFGVVDESNWMVCEQSPAAGETGTDAPSLTVDRSCGDEEPEPIASPSAPVPEPSAAPSEAPEIEPSSPAEETAITASTSPEFAAILADTDYCSSDISSFAEANSGATIEFEANIGALNLHGDASTRYDILIGAGDFSETSAPGPAFQFRDVNTTSDLNITNADEVDSIGVGTELHVVARIVEFEEPSCLFLLDPVETEIG